MAVGAPDADSYSGQVSIFRFPDDSDEWIPVARFNEGVSQAFCGFAISLSSNGNVVVTGCPFTNVGERVVAGVVHVYRKVPCEDNDLSSLENRSQSMCSLY